MITELKPNEIFVFGSNGIGAHAGGAAKTAHDKFGYPMGVSTGIVGQAYGIDTMGRKDKMIEDIGHFVQTARCLPALTFYLTPIGQGIAGYSRDEILAILPDMPSNVIFTDDWNIIS